jgi:hypothetical protein
MYLPNRKIIVNMDRPNRKIPIMSDGFELETAEKFNEFVY